MNWSAAIAIFVVIGSSSISLAVAGEPESLRIGRYTVERLGPRAAEAALLDVVVEPRFPDRVEKIGEAAGYLLGPIGYRLARSRSAAPSSLALLELPLPEVHRSLSRMTVRQAIATLAGPAFRIVVDEVSRRVAYELAPNRGAAVALVALAETAASSSTGRLPSSRKCGKESTVPDARTDGASLGTWEPSDPLAEEDRVLVHAGDSLGLLVQAWQPGDVTLEQLMLATLAANPHAFQRGNINALKRGAVLRRPTRAAMQENTADEARRVVGLQWAAYRQKAQ